MQFYRLILALVTLFVPIGLTAHADPADIAAASRGVVRVVIVRSDGRNTSLIGYGSGFAVGPDTVVTNAHVVTELRNDPNVIAGIVPSEGRDSYPAKLVALSPGNDLALLRIGNGAKLPALTLFPGQVQDGSEVAAIGYPGNVDEAQGLGVSDLITPQDTVKTYGTVSSGRSSRQFDTILHTAQLGAGNSGGPLLDTCGRVIGVNSFGTVSDNGTDSSFFFAISMRELAPFLKQAGIVPHSVGLPCTSIADLNRADSQRAADDSSRAAAADAARGAARERALDKARHDAELDVLANRDNGLALAALLGVLALAALGWGLIQTQRGTANPYPRATRVAFGGAGALVLAGLFVWLLRPPLDSIDDRAKDLMADAAASASAAPDDSASDPATARGSGKLVCVLDPQRSRVTVSDITDVPLEWTAGGCVNGRTQFGLANDGWSRVNVPANDQTISITHYDPATRGYTVENFLVGIDAMTVARAERQKIAVPQCGVTEDVARQFGAAQTALRAALPAEPNERMRYTCQPIR